jgi:Flp pilus assembly pilin Flp
MNNLFLNLYIRLQILMDREDGQDMIEYSLTVALIAFAAVASSQHLAGGISTSYSHLSTKLGAFIS